MKIHDAEITQRCKVLNEEISQGALKLFIISVSVKQASGAIYRCERGDTQGAIEVSTPDGAFNRTQLSDLLRRLR